MFQLEQYPDTEFSSFVCNFMKFDQIWFDWRERNRIHSFMLFLSQLRISFEMLIITLILSSSLQDLVTYSMRIVLLSWGTRTEGPRRCPYGMTVVRAADFSSYSSSTGFGTSWWFMERKRFTCSQWYYNSRYYYDYQENIKKCFHCAVRFSDTI